MEFTFGPNFHTKDALMREMPAVPRKGEWVTIYGEPELPQINWRVADVHWVLTSEAMQRRVLVEVILDRG